MIGTKIASMDLNVGATTVLPQDGLHLVKNGIVVMTAVISQVTN